MSEKYIGNKLCVSCFKERQKNAQKTYDEHVLTKNWGLYLIPVVSQFAAAAKIAKRITYPDGYDYHVYTDLHHEQWSKHQKGSDDLKRCDECGVFEGVYYQLEEKQ